MRGVMRKSKIEWLKGALGLILCVSAVIGIYYWETYGRIEYTKKDVIVLKESVQALTVINEDHLTIEKRDRGDLVSDAVTNKNELVGKVAKHFIPAKSQLVDVYFEEEGLIPRDGEYIFQLPKGWIASMPSTLRRSDDAYLYPIRSSGGINQAESKDGLTKNVINEDYVEVGSNQLNNSPIKCLKIAFVKNQSNQEVTTVSEFGRLDANSTIATIEVIATLKDINQLNALRKAGYSFIVMYR